MLTTNGATLRAFEARDIPFVLEARNDLATEVASQPTEPRPMGAAVFLARLEAGLAVSSGGQDDVEFVVARADDPALTPVGIAGLYEVDRFNGNAEIGVTLAPGDGRHEGLGLDTYVALAGYAFETLRLHKLYGYVKGSNVAARGACERLGLTEEGVLPEHRWQSGRWVDIHVYGLLARDWDPSLAAWRERPSGRSRPAISARRGTGGRAPRR